jgi:Spy/CpxP family protein refolding chaperone
MMLFSNPKFRTLGRIILMGWRLQSLLRLGVRIFVALTLVGAIGALIGPGEARVTEDDSKKPSSDPPKKVADGVKKSSDKNAPPKKDAEKPAQPPVKVGLSINEPNAFQGYTLIAPLSSAQTYLLDMQGRVVHSWQSDCSPASCGYLLENGHLLRPGSVGSEAQLFGPGPGVGGRIQEFTWEGEVVWDFRFVNSRQLAHHDITPLPNGNVLMIVWDRKLPQESISAGRRPELTGDSHLLPDSLLEIKPTGKTSGEVVWEWHLWDHLVQDYDKSRSNYGNVAEHPELVNINFGEDALAAVATTKDAQDKLKSIGYVGATGPGGRPPRVNPDYTHCNGVSYNPELDQVMVSVHAFSEFWIIDHGTTTAEAAGHQGGRCGKGGDLLYRYGNPRAYRAGTKSDQRLFAQHNAHWIPKGLPGAGHVLVFNNGGNRPDGSYSSVDELVLPVDSQGQYTLKPGTPNGPDRPVWSYTAPKKSEFYSFFISGAQRLPNGNTLICSGANGTVFEVTPEKEIVWKYVNPVPGTLGGPGGFATPPPPGQITTPLSRSILGVTPEQAKQLDEIQSEVSASLDKLLSAEQSKKLKEKPKINAGGGFSSPEKTGQIMSGSVQSRLKLSDDQKKELAALQKKVDTQFDKILNDEQRKRLKGGFAFGGPPPGGGGPGATPQPGQILPGFMQDTLKLTDEQKKSIAEFQKELDAKLDKLLTEEQKKEFRSPQGGSAQPGQIMALAVQIRLKLTDEKRKQLTALQKEADSKLDKTLTEEQKRQFKDLRANAGRGGPGGPGGAPGGPGGPPPGGPGGFGARGGGSPLFRAYRFASSFPGLVGKDLTPGKTIEELQAKGPEKK